MIPAGVRDAHRWGYACYLACGRPEDNPFDSATHEHSGWYIGYLHARVEDLQAQAEPARPPKYFYADLREVDQPGLAA